MSQVLSLSRKDEIGSSALPRLAVIVPIFRHSVLLSEAIESVLAQKTNFSIQLILVNDGCPHHETNKVCRDYALAFETITYLRKPNGGLSDARNFGIRHVLANWPSVEAFYMLDADNRLRPAAMAHAMAKLDENPRAGWVYPNIDMFGLDAAYDYGGEYSVLIHTAMNICEAGSLIRRRVFETGVFFDTSFKSGLEDWDFFLTAADAGFRGVNCENFGFLYRKRAESMLADTEREVEGILIQMQKKHQRIFSPRGRLELEQVEAPRYAIFLVDLQEVMLTVDPDHSSTKRLSMDAFEEIWWSAQTDNSQHHAPPILAVSHSAVIEQLRHAGMLHSVLWALERKLVHKPFAALEIDSTLEDRLKWEEALPENQEELRAALLMVQPNLLAQIMRESSLARIAAIAATPCKISVALIRLGLPADLFPRRQPGYAAAAHDFVGIASRYKASSYRKALSHRWDWREPGIPWRSKTHEISRLPTKADAAYPRVPPEGRDVGFVLPLVEFGGVERVALNSARAMKRAGWRPHLFILDSQSCLFTKEWRETFESVTFLSEPGFATWGSAHANYYGTDVPSWSRHGDQRNATAMLAWLDVVFNFHGGAISGVMGRLKRFGVKTCISLHLSDQSPFKRPVGQTYLGLAFEHAYDVILPCSEQLADWCHAMAVPEEKIVPLLNAPSFELPKAFAERVAARRQNRAPDAPLRAIYLGRLDHQKGIGRLVSIIEMAEGARLPIEWRLVGKPVLDGAATLPAKIAQTVEPVFTTPDELAAAFEWADVLVMPSYYEGLPLTILEAMRSGVVPVATDAGAVAEVVDHWQNGVVLSQRNAESEALAALARLSGDSALVQRLSERASSDMAGRNWNTAILPIMHRLDRLWKAQAAASLPDAPEPFIN